ncbi:MAG: acyltransferase [Clostridia bacterium]|nr:acyltransferase [Clostridia bacterium]
MVRAVLKQDRNDAVSLLRFFAMCFIVACHILRYYNHWLAWWFNVGVQIFLFLSGFLYAGREIPDRFAFWGKNFVKILVDYYLFLFLSFPFFMVFAEGELPLSGIVDIFTFSGLTVGYGHLWFVPYILLCYLLTPLLHDAFARGTRMWVTVVLLCALMGFAARFFFSDWNPAWLNCYLIGFSAKKLQQSGRSSLKLTLVLLPFAGITNALRIYMDVTYFYAFESETVEFFYWILYDYSHVFLGAFLCMLVLTALQDVSFAPPLRRFLEFANRYSYDVYLCHYGIMLGPLTLLGLTDRVWLNILIVVLLTCVFAVVLHSLSKLVKRGLYGLRKGRKESAQGATESSL